MPTRIHTHTPQLAQGHSTCSKMSVQLLPLKTVSAFTSLVLIAEMATGGEPDYALDERSKDGYVRVRVEIPNLKAKGKGMLSKITGGRKDQAKNAQIECDFQERSFALTVTGDNVKGMDGKTWTLGSTKLPHPIDQFSSHWVTEDGFINVFLRKASPGDDWALYIRKGQLEA